MHRCSASSTTPTPFGARCFCNQSAIWTVSRSWTCWLGGIVVNLLTNNAPQYYDIALRDFGLMLAALTLGRLALAVVPAHKRLRS
jgi:hypothetical protein